MKKLCAIILILLVAPSAWAGWYYTHVETGGASIWGGQANGAADAYCLMAYRMNSDGSETDRSGNSNTLTGEGTVVLGTTSRFEPGDGTDRTWSQSERLIIVDGSIVAINSAIASLSGDISFSIYFSFKLGTAGSADEWIFTKYLTTGDQRQIRVLFDTIGTGALQFNMTANGIYDASSTASSTTTRATLADSAYHTAVCVHDAVNDQNLIYIDGSTDGSPTSWAGSIYNSTAAVIIGDDDSSSDFTLRGNISECAVWSGKALTSDEVADLETNGLFGDQEGDDDL